MRRPQNLKSVYSLTSKKFGYFFKFLWTFQKTWTLWISPWEIGDLGRNTIITHPFCRIVLPPASLPLQFLFLSNLLTNNSKLKPLLLVVLKFNKPWNMTSFTTITNNFKLSVFFTRQKIIEIRQLHFYCGCFSPGCC